MPSSRSTAALGVSADAEINIQGPCGIQRREIFYLYDGGVFFFSFCFSLLGLTFSEAAKLDNYLHFSRPVNQKKKSLLEIGDLNPAIDFLDVISDDIPKGKATQNIRKIGKQIQTDTNISGLELFLH